jgi:hypothetical protein
MSEPERPREQTPDPVSIVTSHAEEDWGEDQGAVSSSAKPA